MIHAAAATFDLIMEPGEASHYLTRAPITAVYGPIQTTVVLLQQADTTVCLVTPNLNALSPPLYRTIRETVAGAIDPTPASVVVFSSHNHSNPPLSRERNWTTWGGVDQAGAPELTDAGRRFLASLRDTVARLPDRLQPITVHWAVGHERRISYCRKGHRADGTTYLIREEDRRLLGVDFCGDIDDDASVVRLVAPTGRTVVWMAHFSCHPATAFHPERPSVHPEFPGVAARVLSGEEGAPVAFLQGCCGDVNSKGLLSGDSARAERHGRWLGGTFLGAAQALTASRTDSLGFERVTAGVPFAPLPSVEELRREMVEIDDFLARARAGDEDTLSCVGLNFPRALSPAYRGALMTKPRQWIDWALAHRETGTVAQLPAALEMEICVLRLGDVGIAGMPCEPFTAIGRQIRAAAPLPLTLPCGYCNLSYGYVPDGGNVGDREYMSAFYRYTRRPQFQAPAGDVLADKAVDSLRRLMAQDSPSPHGA